MDVHDRLHYFKFEFTKWSALFQIRIYNMVCIISNLNLQNAEAAGGIYFKF